MSNLQTAMKLYQQNGDSTTSLRECQKVWNGQSNEKSAAMSDNNSNNNEQDGMDATEQIQMPLSRQHNQAILQNLAAQRQRSRRVRPRPSSFDGNTKNDNTNNNNSGGGDVTTNDDGADPQPSLGVEKDGGELITALNNILDNFSLQNSQLVTTTSSTENGQQQQQKLLGNNEEQVQKLIAAYNLSLAHYAQGDSNNALSELSAVLSIWMGALRIEKSGDSNGSSKKESDGSTKVMMVTFNDGSDATPLPLDSTIVSSIISILTRATFLYLDCSFTLHVGNGRGVLDDSNTDEGEKSITVQSVLDWVESTILVYAKERNESVEDGGEETVVMADEVKFKLHLYKSRLLLQGSGGNGGKQQQSKDGEARAKLARKELKNAMDIYQNKLCISTEDGSELKSGNGGSNLNSKGKKGGGVGSKQRLEKGGNNHQQDTSETTSISGSLVTSASDVLWNEGKGGVVARATFEGMPNNKLPQQPMTAAAASSATPAPVKVKKDSPGLHVRHESVLYMKANLEYMRGNTTKSLKLCAEARTAGKKSRAKLNEVPLVNGHAGKDVVDTIDGKKTEINTMEEDVETKMANDYDEAIYYNNLAMVHQSAGKIHVALHYYSYAISYMENVQIPSDNYFWSDGLPRPNVTADILNNAALCAFQAHDFKRAYECMAHCVTLSPSIFGKRARCWLRMAQSLIGIHVNQQLSTDSNDSDGLTNDTSLLECKLGGEEDLHNISSNPMPRILSCLENALKFSSQVSDLDCFEAATLSLAYAKLEIKDAAGALEMCKAVLNSENIAAFAKEDRSYYSSESLRRRAMARLYACEAFCRLGDPDSALFIVESESSLQCLASDMSVSKSAQHDAYSQFATRATASGTFSSTGSFDRSKLHASMTTGAAEALSMEKTRGNIDNVFEKRVHLFSRLKEGDTDGAISILRSGFGRV